MSVTFSAHVLTTNNFKDYLELKRQFERVEKRFKITGYIPPGGVSVRFMGINLSKKCFKGNKYDVILQLERYIQQNNPNISFLKHILSYMFIEISKTMSDCECNGCGCKNCYESLEVVFEECVDVLMNNETLSFREL